MYCYKTAQTTIRTKSVEPDGRPNIDCKNSIYSTLLEHPNCNPRHTKSRLYNDLTSRNHHMDLMNEDLIFTSSNRNEPVCNHVNISQNDYHELDECNNINNNSQQQQQYELILTSGKPLFINASYKQFNCSNFTINDKTVEYKLRSVANCLAYLVQDNHSDTRAQDRDQQHQQCYISGTQNDIDNAIQRQRQQLSMIERRDSFLRDRFRLKKIMNIHCILMRCTPIEAQVNDCQWIRSSFSDQNKTLNRARQQVLRLIENLNGYCDSINLLRCILRSENFAQVILSFDEVVRKVKLHLDTVKHKSSAISLLDRPQQHANIIDDSNIGTENTYYQPTPAKVEFKIVREWTV